MDKKIGIELNEEEIKKVTGGTQEEGLYQDKTAEAMENEARSHNATAETPVYEVKKKRVIHW